MCRTALGALNQWFKWASIHRIRLVIGNRLTTTELRSQQPCGLTPGVKY